MRQINYVIVYCSTIKVGHNVCVRYVDETIKQVSLEILK